MYQIEIELKLNIPLVTPRMLPESVFLQVPPVQMPFLISPVQYKKIMKNRTHLPNFLLRHRTPGSQNGLEHGRWNYTGRYLSQIKTKIKDSLFGELQTFSNVSYNPLIRIPSSAWQCLTELVAFWPWGMVKNDVIWEMSVHNYLTAVALVATGEAMILATAAWR